MSHAFVEVESTQIAGAILRGETQKDATGMGKQGRSAVLGRGRRARGVTITRSSQEELMSSVGFYPSISLRLLTSYPSYSLLGMGRLLVHNLLCCPLAACTQLDLNSKEAEFLDR